MQATQTFSSSSASSGVRFVGVRVGAKDGLSVVGERVVGSSVGVTDGACVGGNVGTAVGLTEGTRVRGEDGDEE